MWTENFSINDFGVCFDDFCDVRFDEIFFFFYDFEVDDAPRKGSPFDQDSLPILSSGETYSSVSDFIYFDIA
jgi:hypothetical protein